MFPASSTYSWSVISKMAFSFLLLASASKGDPSEIIDTPSNIDTVVCSGEDVLGYISGNQETLDQFYTIDAQGKRSIGIGSCGCMPMGPEMTLWLWSCARWPRQSVFDWNKVTSLPYCTTMGSCFPIGSSLQMDVPQSAKICRGSEEIGVLYRGGQAMPKSGKTKDMASKCTCSAPGEKKDQPSVFSCADAKETAKFGVADASHPLVCVSPQEACAGNSPPASR